MYVKDAIRLFGSRAKIVKELDGVRHRSAVYQWDPQGLVPMDCAFILTRKKGGPLNLELYEQHKRHRTRQLARARAARHK